MSTNHSKEDIGVEVIRSVHGVKLNKGDFKDIFQLPIMYLKEWGKKVKS